MKGNPLLRLAIVLLVLLGVLWPVCRLTLHRTTLQAVMPITNSTETHTSSTPDASDLLSLGKRPTLRATLLLHAAPSPQHCLITQTGRKLLAENDQISPGEYRAAIEITKGEDLLVSADWSDEEPHALRLEVLIHGYQAPLEKSFWAQKKLEDTLSLPVSLLP